MKNRNRFLVLRALFYLLLLISIGSCKEKERPEPTPEEPEVTALEGKIYVANEYDGTISVIDASSKKVTKTIAINAGVKKLLAHNVQVAPNGKTVWVTGVPEVHTTNEELVVIDAVADTILHRIKMQAHLHMAHIVFDKSGDFAFITATDADQVIQVNARTYQVERSIPLGAAHEPHGLRYSNGKLFVANMKANSLSVIDVMSGQVQELPVGGMVMQTAVTPDGSYVFASLYDTKEVVRYHLKTKVLDRIDLPAGAAGPIQLYPSPDNKLLFVCDQGMMMMQPVSDKVYVIDIEQAIVTNAITVEKGPHGVVLSPDGKTAYVTNNARASVSVIDVATKTQTDVIKVGNSPNGISYGFTTGSMP